MWTINIHYHLLCASPCYRMPPNGFNDMFIAHCVKNSAMAYRFAKKKNPFPSTDFACISFNSLSLVQVFLIPTKSI